MRRDITQVSPAERGHVELARGLAAHARLKGMSQVVLGPDGASVADGHGRSKPATRGGRHVAGLAEAVHATLRHMNTSPYDARERTEKELAEVDLGSQGKWTLSRDGDTVTLKAEKPCPSCVDSLLPGVAEAMPDVRALYGKPGTDIVVHCVGGPRSREMARAIGAEMAAMGVPFALSVTDADWRRRNWVPEAAAEVDLPPGTASEVRHLDRENYMSVPETPHAATRVTVSEALHWHRGRLEEVAERLGDRPVALVSVELASEDSKPRLRAWLSPGARRLAADPAPVPADAPWVTLAARRERHHANRKAKPRTWHSTTEQVAVAYAAREAPRGKVSGDTLFFHGPIMWSLYRTNPVAAFVTDTAGNAFVLEGRSVSGGTEGGTVTSATGDVERALRGRFETLDVRGDMSSFLRWDGMGLAQAFAKASRGKCEDAMAATCTVDGPALSAWLAKGMAAARREQEEAMKSRFPTVRLFDALRDQVRLIGLGETLGARLGLEVEPPGDRVAVEADMAEATRVDSARKADIAARKAEKAERAEAAAGRGGFGP